jgi:hypothetical protein
VADEGRRAQVDFGAGLIADPTTGQMRKTWVFVMTNLTSSPRL